MSECVGRYFILKIDYLGGNTVFTRLPEMFAWTASIPTVSMSNFVKTNLSELESGPQSFDTLFGPQDSIECKKFGISTLSGTGKFSFDLGMSVEVHHVWFFIGDSTNNPGTLNVSVTDGSSVTTSCGDVDVSSGIGSIACTDGISANKITVELSNGGVICRIAVLEQSCDSIAPSITQPTPTTTTVAFNLLTETTLTVALPTVLGTPIGCFTSTWKLYYTSDGSEKGVTFTSNEMTLTHDITSVSDRITQFTSGTDYYLQATYDDNLGSQTYQFPVVINWLDDCRAATVDPEVLI